MNQANGLGPAVGVRETPEGGFSGFALDGSF
jgi:hypothetical protein